MRRLRILCGACLKNGGVPTVIGAATHTGGNRRSDLNVYIVASTPTTDPDQQVRLVPVTEQHRRFVMTCPTCLRVLRPSRTDLVDAFDTNTEHVTVVQSTVTVWTPPTAAAPDPTSGQWVTRTRRPTTVDPTQR